MCRDICEAMLSSLRGDMTCVYPDAVESIQGRDANFEFANSSTLKPLLLFYKHNLVTEIHGYIFVQDHLDNFGDWKGAENFDLNTFEMSGDVLSATDLAERIKLNLEDPDGLAAKEVKVLSNLSKA